MVIKSRRPSGQNIKPGWRISGSFNNLADKYIDKAQLGDKHSNES